MTYAIKLYKYRRKYCSCQEEEVSMDFDPSLYPPYKTKIDNNERSLMYQLARWYRSLFKD